MNLLEDVFPIEHGDVIPACYVSLPEGNFWRETNDTTFNTIWSWLYLQIDGGGPPKISPNHVYQKKNVMEKKGAMGKMFGSHGKSIFLVGEIPT